MELILTVLLLSIAATSDSFVIGIGFGLKGVEIHFFSNLYISLTCFVGTAAAMLLGRHLGYVLPVWLTGSLGAVILLALGLWMLVEVFRRREGSLHGVCTSPECVDKDNNKKVELSESIGVGLVLALNNIGLGVGAGISGLPILLTSFFCSVTSFAFMGMGCQLGHKLVVGRFSRFLEIASALLIIWLGIHSFSVS
ncbi:MAG TPA: hypothetical protein GX499_04510 [Clostridiales bacterium]|nr:hypothetical protein [Clostridiales bacterium]